MTFIIQPRTPFSLIVSISARETASVTASAASGPRTRPPAAMTASLGSYFKKSTSGTRPTAVAV